MKKQVLLVVVTLGLQNVEIDITYVVISKQWELYVKKIKIIKNNFSSLVTPF